MMNSNQLTQDQLQLLQKELLDILLDVRDVCERNGISFWLGEGSLLGAVRHGGFIPWDDDLDILMKRSDYERFLSIAQEELKDRYVIQHPSTIQNYWSTFIKVRVKDSHPHFYQGHISKITEFCGPCIDVFPLDYVKHRFSIRQYFQCSKIRLFRRMIEFRMKVRISTDIKTALISMGSHFFSLDWLQKHVEKEMRRQGDAEKEYLAAFSTFHKYKSIIAPAQYYRTDYTGFEGHQMPIPAGYDQLLTQIYGNWREIPEEGKRETKHQYVCAGTD